MKLISMNFTFFYPLKHKIVRDLRIVTEHIGDLVVEGQGHITSGALSLHPADRVAIDIDFIRWNGTDIKPVLELTGQLTDVEEAALRYVADLLKPQLQEAA
ncbi:MAG: hypothetical protein WKF70_08760 [Chitinophagaceae bacterium]